MTGRLETAGLLEFYVSGLLSGFMDRDDPRRERIYASVRRHAEAIEQEAAAAERRRLLEIHMADHDDATGWCPTCALLTEDDR